MIRFSSLIFLSLFLSGCAYLHSLSSDLPQQVDEWVAAKEYGKALETLSYVSKTHKQYALLKQKRHTIQLQANEFEQDQHLKATMLEKQDKWHKANTIYLDSLDKLPQSTLLNTEYAEFLKRRDTYLNNLEIKLSIAKGIWLIESTPIQEKIVNAAPEDYSTQRRYKNNTRELQKTADELITCTATAIHAGRISLAEKCMQTADKLNPPYVDKNKLKKLKAQLAQKHQLIIKEQNTKTRALLSELKQGYSHDNLRRAHRHLTEINEQQKQNKESIKLKKELEKYIKTGLAQRMEAGRRLYSSGQIEQALSIWIPLKSVDPENTKLNDYIERAKRVLSKLKKLSNTPPTITLPQQ